MIDHANAVIHVVDDDPAMRTALVRLLTQSGYKVRSYSSAGEFPVADPDPRPGYLLLDLELPGADGLDLQHALQRLGKQMPIVFISAYSDIPRTVMAIKAGACDFLLKPIDAQTLFSALDNALADASVALSPTDLAEPAVAPNLTAREQAVLRGLVAGRLNKQIAAELALSERTVKSCRADLMRKLHADSFADLVILAEPIVRARASV